MQDLDCVKGEDKTLIFQARLTSMSCIIDTVLGLVAASLKRSWQGLHLDMLREIYSVHGLDSGRGEDKALGSQARLSYMLQTNDTVFVLVAASMTVSCWKLQYAVLCS